MLAVEDDGPVIGAVAYLRRDKGHAVLLRAMPDILRSFPDCSLVIVGDGPEKGSLESLAMDLGIGGSVTFAGLREDVPLVLSAFDVFCQPSVRNEGVPQSVLQAGAAALPVVSTRVGGIPEAVVHGETGFTVRPDDPGALAKAICDLLASPSVGRQMGEAGRQHVSASYSVNRMLDLTEQAYASALRTARSRRRTTGVGPAGP